jgi:uncharacterized protein
MPAAFQGFQDFQRAFARHLRDPHHVARPAGLPARRTALYRDLVFNNLCGFVDRCFPVCRGLLGEGRWRRLCRTFVRDWTLHTPWFREIPREFVRYLAEARIAQPLPAWFAELAHYEWVELALDVSDAPVPAFDPAGDLLARQVVLNPALMNLAYAWPVHRIGPDYRPRRKQPTQLLVYRVPEGEVCFSQTNAVTARLLALLAEGASTGRDAVARLAVELQHPEPERLQDFARQVLAELQVQGIILGAAAT